MGGCGFHFVSNTVGALCTDRRRDSHKLTSICVCAVVDDYAGMSDINIAGNIFCTVRSGAITDTTK